MAFGIDDVLTAAAAAVSLGDTLAKVVKSNSHKAGELHALLSEVRTEAIRQIDNAHEALNQFERTLKERGVDLEDSLPNVIARTPFWRPFESYRLGRAKRALDAMSDSLFRSAEDVNALARCMEETRDTGTAIAESGYSKHVFNQRFVDAPSVRDKIALVRQQLDFLREELGG